MDTKQKHEPKAWDMYRTPDECTYIIASVSPSGHEVMVYWIDTRGSMFLSTDNDHTFIGNILALPELIDVCRDEADCLKVWLKTLGRGPDGDDINDLCDGMSILSSKIEIALSAANIPDPNADHDAAARMLAGQRKRGADDR